MDFENTNKPIKFMSDENTEKFRARLIASGQINPTTQEYGPYERPFMDISIVKSLRQRLIQAGFITPKQMQNIIKPKWVN